MLAIQAVSHTYTKRGAPVRALQDVSLTAAPGEFVAVVGPSGSGKTTLLLTAGGLIRPDCGTVTINGTDVYGLNASLRARLRLTKIGFVFQTFNLIPYLTALQNVMAPLCLQGVAPAVQRSKAAALLEKWGLGDRLRHKPAELSVGEQQRVALARALINDPSVLLADEPTGNLDQPRAHEVIECFERLCADGLTILMVTHDENAAAHAARQVRIVEGKLVAPSDASESVNGSGHAASARATITGS